MQEAGEVRPARPDRLHWLNARKPRCRPVSRPKRRHKGWKALVATGSWKAHLEELSSSSSSNKG